MSTKVKPEGVTDEIGPALERLGRQIEIAKQYADEESSMPTVFQFQVRHIEDMLNELRQALEAALPSGVRVKSVEALAAFLCDEFDFDLDPCRGYAWPEHEKDDGYRGDGQYVKLQPSDVQARARENAKRILAFLSAIEPTQAQRERCVPIYPTTACGECGNPVRPEDETIIGDVPMHKACADIWAARNADAIATEPTQAPQPEAVKGDHPDDLAVDRFAAAMKEKLAKKRAEGRSGWDRKDQCSGAFLSQLLVEHIGKGDPLDVGNLAMMLHQRGERIADERERYADQQKRKDQREGLGR